MKHYSCKRSDLTIILKYQNIVSQNEELSNSNSLSDSIKELDLIFKSINGDVLQNTSYTIN